MSKIEKPEIVADEHLEFLDELRLEGRVNMFGANPYIMNEFNVEISDSRAILKYWMFTFSDRHSA